MAAKLEDIKAQQVNEQTLRRLAMMDQAKPTTSQHARQQQHTLHEVGHAVAHVMAPATLALAASEASTAIKQAAIPLPSAEQTAKADAERRQCWHELRNVVRQIYAEVKANNEYEEGFSISFERTYNMVYRLCKHNPETLFRKLEKEAQNWLEVLRERLVAQLSTTSVASVDRAHKFLLAVQKKYDDLCAANEVFNGVFIYLHNCFLKQFDITFADVNKGLFWETVYLDPILQINLPRLKSQLKRSDPVLQQYMNFEKKLKETRSRWRQLKKRLDQYTLEKQREARLRAECQQLQRRWQKLEEQHRAGEIPDIDPEAIAEHIHSCPFCFHQHLSAMTKKGEDCCASHTNTRHVAAGAAAASVDFVGHAAAAGVNPYHNPCCSASCVYGDPMAGHSMYSTGEELDDDEDDDEDDEGEELDDDEDDEDEYETSIPASAAIPHCQAPGHNTCGTGARNGKTKHAGHCCCLHSHYLMCDHFAESTREKLRSKLSIRSHATNGMGGHAGGMGRDVKAQSPPRPVEDQRSLDELLSFINNTKKTPARGGGKGDDRSSASSASTLASSSASGGASASAGTSSSAKARKKQRKREKRQREREEKEREEHEAKLNQQPQANNNNNGGGSGGGKPKAAKGPPTAAPEDNGGGDGPEDNSSNGPAVPPDEPSEASTSVAAEAPEVVAPGGSRLAAKLAQFTEFPQFWEEEDDLDPDLKAEQDREVEEFRRRLEASGGLAQRQQKKQLNDDNAVELSQLCQSQISMKKVTTTQRWNGMNWVLGQSLVPPQPTATTSSPSPATSAARAPSSSSSSGGQRRTNSNNSNAGGGGSGGKASRGKGKRTKRNGGARARP